LGLAWLLGPGVWVMLDPGIDLKKTYTTRLHSFTDGNILLVCDLEFIGNFFTDEKRSSAFLSSVIPNSIAKSVGKKKKKKIADGFTGEKFSPKKKFALEIYRRIDSVGDSGISSKYSPAPDQMPVDYIPQ
jgi:hypothetical protein